LSAQSAAVSSASSSSSPAQEVTPGALVSVLVTYRSGSLASRLALEGAQLRAAEEPSLKVTELDLDGSATATATATAAVGPVPVAGVRRSLADSQTKILVALEPSFDASFMPIIDSLGLTVVVSSFLEGAIPPSIRGLFSVYPRVAGTQAALDRFFIAKPAVRNFGILCSNSRLGLRYSDLWSEAASKRGVTVPRPECGNEQSSDLRIALLRAKGQQIEGFGVGLGVLNVLIRLRDMAMIRPLLLSALEGEQLVHDTTQDHAALNDVFFDSPVFSEVFTRAFAQRFDGRTPTLSNALGYEAITAVSKSLSIIPDGAVRMRKVVYDGVSGPVDFTVENTGNGAKSVLMHLEGNSAVRMH